MSRSGADHIQQNVAQALPDPVLVERGDDGLLLWFFELQVDGLVESIHSEVLHYFANEFDEAVVLSMQTEAVSAHFMGQDRVIQSVMH